MREYRSAACGLTHDRDIFGVTAECGYISFNPLDTCLLVEKTEVGRCVGAFFAEFVVSEETERTETVVYGYYDNASFCDVFTVEFHFGRISPLESASEKPDKYGKFFVSAFCVGPYIKIKTVFVHIDLGIHVPVAYINVVRKTRNILH